MTFVSKSTIILGMTGAATLFMPALSNAQSGPNMPSDTSSYTVNPAPNGQCWVQTDGSYQRGFGYWGKCPSSETSASATPISNEARGARAQAIKQPRMAKARSKQAQ